jgi:hypothetical protein
MRQVRHRAARVAVLAVAAAVAAVVATVSGCASRVAGEAVGSGLPAAHRTLVRGYFDAVNAAAGQGSDAQQRLFADDQHPDFRDRVCRLDGLTITAAPAYTTLRTDPDWRPDPGRALPRGTIYVVAADVTVHHEGAVLANQIGSVHVVILDGTAYGFAPCPA